MEVEAEAGPSSRQIPSTQQKRDPSPTSLLPSANFIPTALPSQPGPTSAPVQELPRSTFLHLEYPGLVDANKNALHTALESLCPTPPPYATVGSALAHLGRLVSYKSKVIECRLQHGPSTSDGNKAREERTTTEIYRHPLVGVLVDTHDVVAVVRRRVWRRKRRAYDNATGPTNRAGLTLTESSADDAIVKEYSVEALGVAKLTGRWRKMADFAYEPDLTGPGSKEEEALIDVPAALRKQGPTAKLQDESPDATMAEGDQTPQDPSPRKKEQMERGGILAVHDAMARMDFSSLRSFVMPEEKEEYECTVLNEVTGQKETRSNLRLPPPPRFSSIEVPVPYTYRQPPSSSKQPYERRLPDGSVVTAERWSNANRWQGLAPIPWSLSSNMPIPSKPPKAAKNKEASCNREMLDKLRALFEQRPVWSRLSLLNQLANTAERTFVNYSKEYLPLVAYTITDGAWKDTLVRLGFDVRENPDSRFYQKIIFQAHPSRGQRGRGHFKTAYGGVHSSGAGAKVVQRAQARDEQSIEGAPSNADSMGEPGHSAADRDSDEGNSPIIKSEETTSAPLQTHIFNGEEIHRLQSSFQLIDIIDPVALPSIQADGPDDLLPHPSVETGWYTYDALERIKYVVGQRFRHLVEFGVPKDERETTEEIRKWEEKRVRSKERVLQRERVELDEEEVQRAEGGLGGYDDVPDGEGGAVHSEETRPATGITDGYASPPHNEGHRSASATPVEGGQQSPADSLPPPARSSPAKTAAKRKRGAAKK